MLANLNNKITQSTAFKNTRAVLSNSFHYIHKKSFWGLFKKIDEKFFKFIFVGIINAAFSYCIYAILIAIGLIANIALFLQYIIGVLWNFKTTGSIVFKNNNNKLLLKFVLSYVFTFTINSILLYLLVEQLNANEYLAQALLIPAVASISFLIFKFWVFKE